MKTRNLITVLSASLAMIATGASAKDKMESKDQLTSSGSVQMHRVTQESLDQQVTAKDLIGAAVHDSAGEKIGNISDISIKRLISKETAESYARSKKDKYSSKDASWEAENSLDPSATPRDASVRGSMMSRLAGAEATAFISVGGLWGIGDDIVAVPVESLSYDETEGRFTLNASKQQVVALAEQDPLDFSEDYGDSTYSAKQEFDEEVNEIRDAIREDKDLMEFKGIMVRSESDQIVLYGTVSTEEAKDRAEELAKLHSDKDIKNSIKVKKNK